MPTTHLPEITDASFDADVLRSPLPVLVEFTAAWCAPCRAIAPHLEAIAATYAGRLRVVLCDADASPELAAKLEVRSVPTLIVFNDGGVMAQLVGAAPRARLEALIAGVLSRAHAA